MAWLTMGSNNQARTFCILSFFIAFCFRDVYSAGQEDFENRMVQRISFRESMVRALNVPFISCRPDAFSALRIAGFCSNIENLDLLCTDLEVSVSPACATFDGSFCCYISLAQGNSLIASSTGSPTTQPTASTFPTTPNTVTTQQSTSTAGPTQTTGVPSTSAASTSMTSTAGLITSTTQRPTTSTLFTPAFPSTTPTVNPATVPQSTTIQSTVASTTQPATVPSTLPTTTITTASTTIATTTPATSTTARTTLAPTTVTTTLPTTVPTTTVRTNPPTTVTTTTPTTVTTRAPTTITTTIPTTITTTTPTTTVRTNPPTTVTTTAPTTTVPPTTVTTTTPTTVTTRAPTTVTTTTPTTTVRTNPPTVAPTTTVQTTAEPAVAGAGDVPPQCVDSRDPIACPNVRKLILDAHNDFRRLQKAANMLRLEWDDVTAQAAQVFANQCRGARAHDQTFSTSIFNVPANVSQNGQNVAIIWDNWTKVIQEWNNEGQNVIIGRPCPFTADPNVQFGHFTQDVWAATFQIGCAFAPCDNLQYVCNYGPGGNIGNSPSDFCISPYLPGTQQNGGVCGKCGGLGSSTCDNGLCTNACRFKNRLNDDDLCDRRVGANRERSCSNPASAVAAGCQASCNCLGRNLIYRS